MGYACPVCATPQRDAEHLANHLAFTAMLHDDDHREWLDDHVPRWASLGPDDLGPRVVDHAPEATYEAVFDDTTRERGRPFEGGPVPDGVDTASHADTPEASLDGEAAEALATARAMTREMLGVEGVGGGDDPDDPDGGDDPAGGDERGGADDPAGADEPGDDRDPSPDPGEKA